MSLEIKLFPKQRWAFYSPANELLFGGAAGPGKSMLMRVSAIRWCEQIPGIQVYLFRRTFPDLRDNHLRGPTSLHALLASQIQSGDVTYHKQENEFVWNKTNSRISLCHCQYEDDVEKYQGAEIHVLLIDELTHFTEYQYRFLRGRVRCVGLTIPEQYKKYLPRIETASNPGSVGHGWVKRTFVRDPMKIYQTPPEEGGMMRQFIPARKEDNPELLKADPEYEKRLQGLGSQSLVRAMSEGDWDIFAGQFFDDWRREIHILPRDYVIEHWWNRFCGYDHGYNHPFVFGVYASDGDGNVIKFRELGDRLKKPDEIIQAILEICHDAKTIPIHAGHDCWSRQRDGGPSIAEHFQAHGFNFVKANIDRIQGAQQLRQYLYWKKDASGQFTTKPRFYVTENCWRTINCIPSMVFDETRPEDVQKIDATEIDPWSGDDPYDETRYALMSRPSISKHIKQAPQKHTLEWYERQENLYKQRRLRSM